MMSVTELANRVALHEAARASFAVTVADREQMAVALALQGFAIDRAHAMCFDVHDRGYLRNNDGALQMLARHRSAAEQATRSAIRDAQALAGER